MTSNGLFKTLDSSEKIFDFGRNRTRVPALASWQRWPLGHPALIFSEIKKYILNDAHVNTHDITDVPLFLAMRTLALFMMKESGRYPGGMWLGPGMDVLELTVRLLQLLSAGSCS